MLILFSFVNISGISVCSKRANLEKLTRSPLIIQNRLIKILIVKKHEDTTKITCVCVITFFYSFLI